VDEQPLRPLLPPVRKTSSLLAEYIGTGLIPVLFIGMIISLKETFSGPDWECSGSGCLEEFDRLRGWTFPVPLFAMVFICTFGFVAALLLRAWGRSGRPPTFDRKPPVARPALKGVGGSLTGVAVLELGLASAFVFAQQWLTAGILGFVGIGLLIGARGVSSKAARSDRILTTGTPAVAEITAVDRTGASLNDNPLLKLTLTIYDGDAPLFPVVHKEFIPLQYMSRIQIGARLAVKVDPLDSASLVIEWDKDPATIKA
jgi:hypothetical protein